MSLFCLLYIPLLYLMRRRSNGEVNLWALPLGVAAVIVRYLFGPLVTPGDFYFSRWMSGFVDIAGLPALFALIVCGVLVITQTFPRGTDYAGFALLWLIPQAAIQAVSNSPLTPIPLIVVPLLWSAQAVGIPFFIDGMTKNPRAHIVFFSTLAIAALPIAAVTSWWAFFSQQALLGVLLLAVSLVPAAISLLVNREQMTDNREQITDNRERGDRKYLDIIDF